MDRRCPKAYKGAVVEPREAALRARTGLLKSAARFPWERALVMGVAAVVGLYGGIAAGLFTTAIRSV